MRYLQILLSVLIVAILSSCSMTTDVMFNRDYSGAYKTTVDFGGVMDMAQSFDPSMAEDGDTGMDELIDPSIKSRYDSIMASADGISNGQFTTSDDYVVTISFDFDDIESLNAFLARMNETDEDAEAELSEMGMDPGVMGSFAAPSFVLEGKTVIHGAKVPLDPATLGLEAEGMGEVDMASMMEGMGNMMDYQVNMTFKKKIKSVTGEGFDILSQEKKSLKTRIDMTNLLKSGSYEIAVETK
jgi:hypothetical protein